MAPTVIWPVKLAHVEKNSGPGAGWLGYIVAVPRRGYRFVVAGISFGFGWSRDGDFLAYGRGLWARDVALIRDFR